MPSAPVFTAKGLTKSYTAGEAEVLALRGMDLEIQAGEAPARPFEQRKVHAAEHHGGLDHATSGALFFRNLELTALNVDGARKSRFRRTCPQTLHQNATAGTVRASGNR